MLILLAAFFVLMYMYVSKKTCFLVFFSMVKENKHQINASSKQSTRAPQMTQDNTINLGHVCVKTYLFPVSSKLSVSTQCRFANHHISQNMPRHNWKDIF
jgi:hypothetical protein